MSLWKQHFSNSSWVTVFVSFYFDLGSGFDHCSVEIWAKHFEPFWTCLGGWLPGWPWWTCHMLIAGILASRQALQPANKIAKPARDSVSKATIQPASQPPSKPEANSQPAMWLEWFSTCFQDCEHCFLFLSVIWRFGDTILDNFGTPGTFVPFRKLAFSGPGLGKCPWWKQHFSNSSWVTAFII